MRAFGLHNLVHWLVALGLTYAAGNFAVDLAKWIVLIYLAPGKEAKLILVRVKGHSELPVSGFGAP